MRETTIHKSSISILLVDGTKSVVNLIISVFLAKDEFRNSNV